MQNFFLIGKILTLGFWILPVLAFMDVFPESWNAIVLIFATVIFVAHLGELFIFYRKLDDKGYGEISDIIMVILVGLFHWMPLLKESALNEPGLKEPGLKEESAIKTETK